MAKRLHRSGSLCDESVARQHRGAVGAVARLSRDCGAGFTISNRATTAGPVTPTVGGFTCSAPDATSLVASTTCTNVNAPAWTLPRTTLSATATDNAGNVGSGSTSFTIALTASGICGLVQQWVSGGVRSSLCVKLDCGSYDAFANEADAQRGKRLTSAQADVLIELVRNL
jgi:hypothetical protein